MKKEAKKETKKENEPFKIGFRVGNDTAGKFRVWTNEYFGDQWENMDLPALLGMLRTAQMIRLPVYFFGLMDDDWEETIRLDLSRGPEKAIDGLNFN